MRVTKSKTCICGDLVEEIGLAQATISQHLKELKKTISFKKQVFAIASTKRTGENINKF